ncbi:MAG: hypothetical protein LUF92_17520 [Clostridiales bacterium]|nr:hypothetical protein [Clostridiales bacterium]
MKSILSRIIAVFLVAIMICTVLPVRDLEATAFATDSVTNDAITSTSENDYYTSVNEAAAALREGLKDREGTIEIKVANGGSADEELASDIWDIALEHTGNPEEGDYILFNYLSMSSSVSMTSGSGYQTCIYTVSYLTTAEQETVVTEKLNDVMDSLDLDEKCDYQKIYAIYDWICSNVTYDYDHAADVTYVQQYTAYGALIDGASSCQGFALLLYRMLLEADIDARIIKGTSQDSPHVWNIVKLGNYYYNLDSNWDSVYVREYGATSYGFLLKCDDSFGDHTRDSEYTTDEFQASYPISSVDYAYTNDSDHGYGDPVFTWADDYSSCTATFTCKSGDGDVRTVVCTVSSQTNNGTTTYTATCSFQGTEYSAEVDSTTAQASVGTGATSDSSSNTGNSSDSGTDALTTLPAAEKTSTSESTSVKLSRPTSVKLNILAKGIRITWKGVSKATGYIIYRKTGKGSYVYVGRVAKTSWTDTSVSNGKKYSYKVYAYYGSVKSSASSTKSTYFLKGASLCGLKVVKGKKLSVNWKKNAKAFGCQIQYSTSRRFLKSKTIIIRGRKKITATLSGLKKGKKYYVRVRSYMKVSGKKYYSAWSSTKRKKISK